MIFYFSGTGNSLYAAKTIAQAQGEKLVSIAHEMQKEAAERIYKPGENEVIGFVYPIYAWNAPRLVLDFIRSMHVIGEKRYIFSINTCGSEEGYATQVLQKLLMKKGLTISSAFSISMPSNYITGEDIQVKEVQEEKLYNAKKKLEIINDVITSRKTDVFELRQGSYAWVKTVIVNPLFNKFSRSTNKFYVTNACIKCGLCQKICPVRSITLDEKPVWSQACTQCLACINRCPVHAIQYGKDTEGRGRYVHPEL